jgi:hypothetical protein
VRAAALLDDRGLLDAIAPPGRWITLSNGKRIKIDEDGRIVAGLPERYQGTSVHDLSRLSHAEREVEEISCADVGAHDCPTCRQTFRTKDEGAAAIFAVNPTFAQLSESEFGQYDVAFLRWHRNGRRGPKPRTKITDGRLDAINERFELKGANKVASFTEAVYWAIPASRRWEDLPARLEALGDVAGFTLEPPEPLIQLQAARLSVEECEQDVDRRLAALFDAARAGRLEALDELAAPEGGDDAPF